MRLWDHLRARQQELSSNQFRKLCRTEYLNYLRVREWQDLYSQLRQMASSLGVRLNHEPAHPDHVHQALLSGLLSHLGMRDGETKEFKGARNAKFVIAPGSAVAKKPPKWVMAAELVETNRLWARVASRVQPEWAERLGAHLAKYTYSEPHWDPQRAAPMTTEKVLLFGLPIVTGRQVNYGKVDRAAAREMFIRHALVAGDWRTHHSFIEQNTALLEELRELEVAHASPRPVRDDDESVFAFYDGRVGADVVSAGHFERWWKRARAADPSLLTMTLEALLDPAAGPLVADAFPEVWEQGELAMPLSYEFEPGSPDDGATVHMALSMLNQVSDDGFQWLVPGLRTELVAALIRTLPKPLRRLLVPAAETAATAARNIDPADGPLLDVLAAELSRLGGERIRPSDFGPERLPDHLRVTFAVEDPDGGRVARSKDLAALKAQLLGRARVAIARAAAATDPVERTGLTDWTFGKLPPIIDADRGGHAVRGYPALVDDGDTVSIRVLTNEITQSISMRAGTRRLLLLTVPVARKVIERQFDNATRLALARTNLGTVPELVDQCVTASVDHLLTVHGGPVWDDTAFRILQQVVRADVVDVACELANTAGQIVVAASATARRLEQLTAPSVLPSVGDASAQLARLVRPGFVVATGVARLGDVLRYVQRHRTATRQAPRRTDEGPPEDGPGPPVGTGVHPAPRRPPAQPTPLPRHGERRLAVGGAPSQPLRPGARHEGGDQRAAGPQGTRSDQPENVIGTSKPAGFPGPASTRTAQMRSPHATGPAAVSTVRLATSRNSTVPDPSANVRLGTPGRSHPSPVSASAHTSGRSTCSDGR